MNNKEKGISQKVSMCKGPEVGEGHKCGESRVQQKTELETPWIAASSASLGLCLHYCLYP